MALDVRGKTVVLTGTFSRLKRADAEKQLAALGAKIGSGVGKSTHVLFAGEKAGSKINAANSLGVTVLGEDDLMAVLRGGAAAEADESSAFAGLDGSLAAAALASKIEALPWDEFEADRDLWPLREALYVHEQRHGVTAAHRAATAHVRPLAVLQHGHGHDVDVEWSDLSPDGRFLATGSWTGSDYELGGVLQIWDVRAGRCVNMLRVRGGVGWPDYGPCVQWRPDGRRVGLTFDTNGVGSFDPFARTGEPESCAYITDGWSRPPAWAWSPNSRDVYIACWGPNLALGAVVPLVGRSPQPRWCAGVARGDDEEPRLQPMKRVSWRHPDRIVGVSGWDQTFALDARTGELLWDGKAHPPVAFSPDGGEFAMHPAGIVYYDTATGLPNGKLPMHVGAESFVWSKDGKRMAALVQPDNKWQAEAGVFVYDGGKYRYSPDAPAPRTGGSYAATWSPDGGKLAVTSRGRLQIWELGEAPALRLDVAAPGSGVSYGDGVLVAWGSFGLTFVRESDGATIGAFKLAIEASGDSPLAVGGEDYGEGMAWNPAFPLDGERVAAALPEGVVIGPDEASASVEEVDGKIAWVVDRKWAWPWRWGEAKVWPDAASACADKAAPAAFKRKFAAPRPARKASKKTAGADAAAPASPAPASPGKSKTWPPPGGSIDDIAALLEQGVQKIRDGYHGGDYRRKLAARTMALGLFDRAAAAIDGGAGWSAWDPWWSAYARGEAVVTALTGRVAGAPALTDEQQATLRRWLTEGEEALKKIGRTWPPCRPQALLGAGWALLGEARKGEKLLKAAVAGIDPENNQTEHRAVVAEAFAALGRVDEAIDHLTSGGKVSWSMSPPAIAAICRRASAAQLERLLAKMTETTSNNEFVLLERGLTRLIALKEWDAAWRWLGGFEGLSTYRAEARLVEAMAAAGAGAQAETRGQLVDLVHQRCAESVEALARVDPQRARAHFDRILAQAPKIVAGAYYPGEFLAALAGAAARLGRLADAERLEASGRTREEKQAVRFAVLATLDPADAAWAAWFSRARAGEQDKELTELAGLAARGKLADAGELLDRAIEHAREGSYPDIKLEEVSRRMAEAGDLNAAYKVWRAISKGMRSYRNGPLLDACVATEAWAGALEVLRAMPQDLNGAPQKASQILLKLGGGEGW